MLEQEITVVILAGGRGRRMDEQDKGLVELKGKPLVAHVIDAISQQNQNILINANQNLGRYQAYGCPVVSDQISGFQGPLAGIATAMKSVTTPYILTLPCDAPVLQNPINSGCGRRWNLSKLICWWRMMVHACNPCMRCFRYHSMVI